MNKHPEKLYKYRPWNENTKQLLLNNQIYIPSPETFNDPFENELKINFNLLNEDQYRIKYVDFLLETYRGKIEKLSLNKSQLRDSINKTLLEDVLPLHKEHRKIIRKIGYKNWGIFCSSEVNDNILMWSHYAQSHLGICIEYDFNSLSNLKIFKDGSQVFYNSRYPTIDPLLLTSNEIPLDIKMLILFFYNKIHFWSYEREYRMTILFDNRNDLPRNRLFNINKGTINKIIMGARFPENQKPALIKICRSNNLRLTQMKQEGIEYKIIEQPIIE